jgi:Cu/Ag efflux protein CusF
MNRTSTGGVCAAGALLVLTLNVDAATMSGGSRAHPPVASNSLWLAQAQQANAAKIFSGVGIVTAVAPAGTLTISHEPIVGLMPAMEMTFSVKPPALAKGVHSGDKIEFSVDGKTYTIVGLKIRGQAN